jgi:drug/metabolite transporter (DMT)-like permease
MYFSNQFVRLGIGLLLVALIIWVIEIVVPSGGLATIATICTVVGVVVLIIGVLMVALAGHPRGGPPPAGPRV